MIASPSRRRFGSPAMTIAGLFCLHTGLLLANVDTSLSTSLLIPPVELVIQKVHNDIDTTTFNNSLDPHSQSLYFTQVAADFSRIIIMKGNLSNGNVTSVSPITIQGLEVDGTDIHISPDGQKLLYVARQPLDKATPMVDHDIYVSTKAASGWSMPTKLPENINSKQDEFYPSMTANGDVYFARRIAGDNLDIFVSRLVDGQYQVAERLGSEVNTTLLEGDPFVAPDESFLLFARMKDEDSVGMTDLYVSFNQRGHWSKAQNLGKAFNSEGIDGSPFVSRNNLWLYFTSNRESQDPAAFDNGLGIYRVALKDVLAIADTRAEQK
ncbi:PD40 domain-containing protein [Alteromonas facilis]|uniref:PD40 domain-containing protein n=1 Tax=Alteromonas facilis TaxID=2048004 RepID=UPI000C28E408|nr:PD40 domain-containing protein [Alteromonas facilis]